ncbi:hypothetical protein ACFL4P_02120 [Gemmatimonadota bacterium]
MNTKQQNTKRALTISEAAQYACVSRGIIESWLAQGFLPYEELPGTVEGKGAQRFRRIRREDLYIFLDEHYYCSSKPKSSKIETIIHKPLILLSRSSLENKQGLP